MIAIGYDEAFKPPIVLHPADGFEDGIN